MTPSDPSIDPSKAAQEPAAEVSPSPDGAPAQPGDPSGTPPIRSILTPGRRPWHKGRAPVSSDKVQSAVLQARVGSERLDKYHRLGGAAWLRALLDATPLPPEVD